MWDTRAPEAQQTLFAGHYPNRGDSIWGTTTQSISWRCQPVSAPGAKRHSVTTTRSLSSCTVGCAWGLARILHQPRALTMPLTRQRFLSQAAVAPLQRAFEKNADDSNSNAIIAPLAQNPG